MSETPGSAPVTTRLVVPESVPMVALLGSGDQWLRVLEEALVSDLHVRGNEITLTGTPTDNAVATRLIDALIDLVGKGQQLSQDVIDRTVGILRQDTTERPADVLTLNIVSNRGRTIRPKTLNQRRYVEAIDDHTIVFGIGPAGTGKTYLAIAKAVQALQAKQVSRIILTRPAVEAGEKLGFLPGSLYDKIDPYLRPLYDALREMLDPETIPRLMADGTIEVAPLAYMRGRAQPVDTPVLTPEGFRPMGELEVGDLVYGANGEPTPVLGVYPQGRKEVFRVATQDGASTLACAEHLWFVKTRSDYRHGKPGRVVQTKDMMGRLRLSHQRDFELPVVAPMEFPAVEVSLDPYALGLLLGDGCISGGTTPSVSTRDPELAAALQSGIPSVAVRAKTGSVGDFVLPGAAPRMVGSRAVNPLTDRLRGYDLLGTKSATKFVPPEYLLNSVEVRLAVLQGLLDTDGGPVTQAGRSCRVQYTTCSDLLRDDVMWLVRSLGGVAYVRTRPALDRRPGYAGGRPVPHRHDAHILDVRLPAGVAPFRLARKKELYDLHGGGRPMRFVDSIEPAGEAECVCISVGAADSLYVTSDFLVTHNTLSNAFIILDEAQNTSAEQMKMFLTRLGFGSKIVVTGDITQVDLPGGTVSGLRVVRDILDGVEDVHFAVLSSEDVVRHRLVGRIVDAYEQYDAELAQTVRAPGRRDDHRRGPR